MRLRPRLAKRRNPHSQDLLNRGGVPVVLVGKSRLMGRRQRPMAKLSTKSRNALPKGDFAGPDRSYPVNDRAHAIAAKARATQFASPAEKAKIDAKANRVLGTKSTAKELDRRL